MMTALRVPDAVLSVVMALDGMLIVASPFLPLVEVVPVVVVALPLGVREIETTLVKPESMPKGPREIRCIKIGQRSEQFIESGYGSHSVVAQTHAVVTLRFTLS